MSRMPMLCKPRAAQHRRSCPLSPLQRQAHRCCNRAFVSNSEPIRRASVFEIVRHRFNFMSLHHHRLERIHAFCFVPISLFVSSVSTKLALSLWPLARLAQDEELKNPDAPCSARRKRTGDSDFPQFRWLVKLPTDQRRSVLTSS